ncbi:hypothetical protein NC797_11295 [Aquibacillus sp. 3ASR75-11]|uniref:Uncharacterized protein n=1 Tax=Terrihalobacillus insolitus TaxID=2950438 RepID=A0A9X3WVR1_9BACI|nr:hypothetical protein [Terrihalobacillus insolitus]MDC3414593.1 hypothetical protein [Terrihalobacillus insolitus]MDC3425091.1 hypothetical protein [Terrihalobacillus insolitus]
MLYTFLVILGSFILGFILYQISPIQVIFEHTDLLGMFQIANFIILVVILYLLLKKRSE